MMLLDIAIIDVYVYECIHIIYKTQTPRMQNDFFGYSNNRRMCV